MTVRHVKIYVRMVEKESVFISVETAQAAGLSSLCTFYDKQIQTSSERKVPAIFLYNLSRAPVFE